MQGIEPIDYIRERSKQAMRATNKSRRAIDIDILLKEIDRLNGIINRKTRSWIVIQSTDDDLIYRKFDTEQEAREMVDDRMWPYVMIEAVDGYYTVENNS